VTERQQSLKYSGKSYGYGYGYGFQLLFTKLRKATISFVLSVCLSVHMEQLGSHWSDFHEILYLSIFLKKYGEKIQVSLKSDKHNRYCTVLYCTVLYCTVHEDQDTFLIVFLLSNFRRVLYVVCFLLGNSPGVQILYANVSQHSVCPIFIGG
jgi:hypothetical protein